MTIAKISILIGASVITAGTSAAVATRDKWLPKSERSNTEAGGAKQKVSSPETSNSGGNASTGVVGDSHPRPGAQGVGG